MTPKQQILHVIEGIPDDARNRKQQIFHAIEGLPDGASYVDALERLRLLELEMREAAMREAAAIREVMAAHYAQIWRTIERQAQLSWWDAADALLVR